ncbi:hypothetical protein ES708_16659 [subsurface metagenome]
MPEIPGDPEVAKIFGFPGLEAALRVNLKYVNLLREEQGNPALTWEQYRAEIEEKMDEISNGQT